MMFGLFFVTCLASNPAHCVMRTHYFDEPVTTPQQCLAIAQPTMASWQNDHEHERWRIERFRCGKPPRDPGSVI
ncbi:hypothetical protein [Methylobacterium sp. WL9]|uniref:hypothetical protein n=1 Tax=Methylobacterium sp. WL9 TaxID=2603898 RepID=UPI0011C7ACEE|nr:hypothetical protein [Methylobacterium sp. WL9]TXN21831.1 hypothetical protein FV217_13105 [Methylobacterium sp. WL9]